jgi:hypothetical protein
MALIAGLVVALTALPRFALAQEEPAEAEEVDGATEVDEEEGVEEGEEGEGQDPPTKPPPKGEAADEEEGEDDEAQADEEKGEEAADEEEGEDDEAEADEEEGGEDDEDGGLSPGAASAEKEKKTDGAATSQEDKKGVKVLKKGGKNGRRHFTAIGAAPIDREDTALRVAVGYPEFQALYHMPFDRDLEWAVGGGVFYGLNAQTAGDITGGMVLAEGRWRFFHDQDHSIALVAAPAFMLGADTKRNVLGGFVIDFPGVTYDYEIKGEHHAVLGFHVPWGIFVSREGTGARIPFVFKMGMEFAVSQAVHVFVTSELGVDVWAGKLPDEILSRSAYLFARGLAGAAFTL